jgi:hypothetical protein
LADGAGCTSPTTGLRFDGCSDSLDRRGSSLCCAGSAVWIEAADPR